MRSSAWPTAGIASLAPLLALAGLWVAEGASLEVPFLGLAAAAVGAIVTIRRPLAGRILSTAGLVTFFVAILVSAPPSPAPTLGAVLVAIALIGALWGSGTEEDASLSRRRVRELAASRTRLAALAFLAEWVLVVGLGLVQGPQALAAAASGLAFALGFGVAWTLRARRRSDPAFRWPIAALLPLLVGLAIGVRAPEALLSLGAVVPVVTLVVARPRDVRRTPGEPWWEPIVHHTARLLVVTFFVLCFLGTIALAIPASSASGRIDLLDAAFTAVSAVCVTGLVVLDTPTAFSGFGEAALLVLIQLGGLGIMSFATLTFTFFGLRPSLRHETAVVGLVGAEHRGALASALHRLLLFTFAVEGAGAVALLLFHLHAGRALGEALWLSVFTAVSAFCNAGFALASGSLIGHQQDPFVLHVVAALIVIGGLSPATCASLTALPRTRAVPLEHKFALAASIALLLSGTAIFLALEWNNTLAGLSVWDRVHNAWFQSVTTRTAGFNSVDMAELRPATASLVLALMFIGGSPGGTAGGVKTTTAVVLLLAVVSAVRGRWVATAFGRRLSHRTVYKAASIVTLGILSLALALFAIQLTQTMDAGTAIFEVVSALGTVGLSQGGTSQLDSVGKIIIMACMFAGRVGPLSLFLFLGARASAEHWDLVEEDVAVG
jgi:trk system potassium uptake protein TrkH